MVCHTNIVCNRKLQGYRIFTKPIAIVNHGNKVQIEFDRKHYIYICIEEWITHRQLVNSLIHHSYIRDMYIVAEEAGPAKAKYTHY